MVNNIRSLCRVAYSAGAGQGGLMVTLRFDVAPPSENALQQMLTAKLLPALAQRAGITGAHLCLADKAASAVQTEEKKSRPQQALVPAWVVLVEGAAERATLLAACGDALSDNVLNVAGAQGIARGLYQLQYTCVSASGNAGQA